MSSDPAAIQEVIARLQGIEEDTTLKDALAFLERIDGLSWGANETPRLIEEIERIGKQWQNPKAPNHSRVISNLRSLLPTPAPRLPPGF